MSRGEIIRNLGEGQYLVAQKLASAKIQAELERLNKRIAELATLVPQKRLELIQAEQAADSVAQEIDGLIPGLAAGDGTARTRIAAKQAELALLQPTIQLLRVSVADLVAENLSILKRRRDLEETPSERRLEAWCADYSLDIEGEVGLIDINDEGGIVPIVQPGFAAEEGYRADRDGELFPNIAQSGPQIFFNAAILPGVQKWMPRYRVGTILSIAVDGCSVALDPAVSSIQDLPINTREILNNVPVKYMNCNEVAFEEGDRVVVRFTRSGPLVIGFESNPRACSAKLICTPILSTGVMRGTYYGIAFEEEDGTPINPPLGEENDVFSAWVFNRPPDNYIRGIAQNYGLRNWVGSNPADVVSWHGPASRIASLQWELEAEIIWTYDWSLRPPMDSKVFHKGELILDIQGAAIAAGLTTIDGAAIVYKDKQRFLRVCTSNTTQAAFNQWTSSDDLYRCRIIDFPWQGKTVNPDDGVLLSAYDSTYLMPPSQGMYFSGSGNKAVMCFARHVYSVLVLRWSEGGGFTEEPIWQTGEDQDDGTAINIVGVAGSDRYTGEEKDGTRAEYERVIGYEFVGESERAIRFVYGAATEREDFEKRVGYTIEYLGDDEFGRPVHRWNRQTERQTLDRQAARQPNRIYFGGQLLCEEEAPSYWNEQLDTLRSRATYPPEPYFNGSGSTISGSGWRESVEYSLPLRAMLIDARIGVCAVHARKVTVTSQTVGAGEQRIVSTQNLQEASYRLYRKGVMLSEILSEPVLTTTESISQVKYQSDLWLTETRVGVPTNYENRSSFFWRQNYGNIRNDAGFLHANAPNSPLSQNIRIRQASFAESGGKLAAGIEWLRRIGETEYEEAIMVYFDGVPNPVQTIMERDPEDGFMFANFGLY